MTQARTDVIVRCRNEMPYAARTFSVLRDASLRVLVFDNGSTDGSREAALEAGFEVIDVPAGDYVPGRVLNLAMARSRGDVVCFVNADAVPESVEDVHRLAEPCRRGAAATYGRQLPRAGARPSTRLDHGRVFPEDADGPGFRHFFSMAASAIRRDVWEILPFDEAIRYSEDIDWTYRVRALGRHVRYVPEARFEHSHDYDRRGLWRRMVGEGIADRFIYRLGPPDPVRTFARPLAGQLLRDRAAGVFSLSTAIDRTVAQTGRLWGRAKGWGSPPWGVETRPLAGATGFTKERQPDAEALVGRVLDEATSVIERELAGDLEALVLIGGYAGGEGAIDWVDGRPAIHNDVDLVAVVPSARRARSLRARCVLVSDQASEASGATVDVFPIGRAELARPNGKLLWLDAAVRGAKVIAGDAGVLEPLTRFGVRQVVAGEVGRLVMNRATGLALSRLAFAAGSDEEARAARHVAKAWLALGDALLLSLDRYAGSSADRLARLEALAGIGAPWVGVLADGYARALAYRQDPAAGAVAPDELADQCARMWPVCSAIEAQRLDREPWSNPDDYAAEAAPRFPELVDVPVAGRWLAGPRAALRGRVSWRRGGRHPREVLARAAVLLGFSDRQDAARRTCAEWLGLRNTSPESVQRSLEQLREVAA